MQSQENPTWRPEWKRKQKRTTKDEPSNIETDNAKREQVDSQISAMIPLSAKNNIQPLSLEDFEALLQALACYSKQNTFSYSVSAFLIKYTDLEPDYISNHLGKNKENPLFEASRRLYSRTRKAFEQNILNSHIHNNPQFAQFYLKNKFNYIDKTEGGGNTTNIAIDARSFLQQLGKLPNSVVDSKHLPDNNNPTDTPKAINQ